MFSDREIEIGKRQKPWDGGKRNMGSPVKTFHFSWGGGGVGRGGSTISIYL